MTMSTENGQWSNPAEVMKRRKLKRKSKSICSEYSLGKLTPQNNQNKSSSNFSVKRSNPFSCDVPNKRRAISDISSLSRSFDSESKDDFSCQSPTENDCSGDERNINNHYYNGNNHNHQIKQSDADVAEGSIKEINKNTVLKTSDNLFSVLDTEKTVGNHLETNNPLKSTNKMVLHRRNTMLEDIDEQLPSLTPSNSISATQQDNSSDTVVYDTVPVDWSLKAKVRIVSRQSLSWCVQMKSTDEAQGLHTFVGSTDQWHGNESSFHRCTMYWQHPTIPWTKLFPRIVSENKISRTNVFVNNEDIKKSLYSDWVESFTSVFHQLRSSYCPYFYLCTHQLTVLFRGASVSGHQGITALVSPTTRGFREALKVEGISFTMPVLEKKKIRLDEEEEDKLNAEKITNSLTTEKCEAGNENTPEGDDCLDTDEGASVWLESMGLDKKQFPSLDPNKVKIQKEGFRRVDNRPESMIYVEGGEVQALFNFLLNCRSCIASSGEQAGLPPTILSPSPFTGATLKSNKVKHSCAKQTDEDGNSLKSHVLEIIGPLLPHNVLNIASLLHAQISSDFSFTFNNHEPTAPFNISLCEDDPRTERSENCVINLRPDVRDSLYSRTKFDKNVCCIKQLIKTTEGYHVHIN